MSHIWNVNDLELELDLADADILEQYQKAIDSLDIREKELIKIGKQIEIHRAYCDMFYDFFDMVFEKEISIKIFNGKKNSRVCEEVFESFISFANLQVKENNARRSKAFSKYQPKGK